MSWLYSQALVEEYLGENSLDGAQSAPLNGSRTQQAYCAPDKMMDFSRLSQFGMTYKPLTENLGQELLTLYLAGFHARTSAQQEKAQELTENEAECGEKWHASFTKYDPDLSLWKTPQCSLLGDSEEFLETWPQWGLMRNGECWEQRTLAQTIKGTEFGLSENRWPTPLTQDSYERSAWKIIAQANEGGKARMTLTRKVKYLEKMPSPKARDWKDGRTEGTSNRQSPDLGKVVGQSKTTGSLNPTWVEWLMGWPLGWTDLKPLEMDKCHSVQQLPGESSQEGSK